MSLWSIERLDKVVSIAFSEDIDIDQTFAALFSDFQLNQVDQATGVLLEVNTVEQGWSIVDTKLNETKTIKTTGDLIYFLSDKIIFHLVDRIDIGHCVHAACVAKGDQAFVLPANSGSGKSSFTCWLVANGFEYITDELTILLEQEKVSAIPRPIQIKQHGLQAIKPLLRDHKKTLAGNVAHAISAKALGGQRSVLNEWQLKAIIFPHYIEGSGFSYQPLASASVVMELMGSHVNARNVDSHGFRFMTDLARKVPAFKLGYGGFAELPSSFVETIETLD